MEVLLFERGIDVTYEAIRQWCRKFGQDYANQLRHRRPQPGDKWSLDEVFQTIATDLRSQVTDAQRAQWTSTSPKDWANESFQITTSPDVEYCVRKNNACWYQANNRTFDLDEEKKVVTVNEAYMEHHLPTIKLRLTQAGVRLGKLLNQALGGE